MSDEEKEFHKKINIDKAIIKTKAAIFFMVFSLLTYIEAIFYQEFDFGMIFEIFSLAFLIIAKNYMAKYDENHAKIFVRCSLFTIGWILVYDIMALINSVLYLDDLLDLGLYLYFGEGFTILYLIMLFAIYRDLAKAENPIKYKENTDWFYEKYEGKENKEQNKGG